MADELPTWDEALAQHSAPEATATPEPQSGGKDLPTWDQAVAKTNAISFGSVNRIMKAFGTGYTESLDEGGPLGIEPGSETDKFLSNVGLLNGMQQNQGNIMGGVTDVVIRKAAGGLDALNRLTLQGLTAGWEKAGEQVGVEIGSPAWGREIASLPQQFMESMPTGIHATAGMPHLPRSVAKARAAAIIGEGEAGYLGLKEATPAELAARHSAAESVAFYEPKAVAPTQDIHRSAFNIAPEKFREYNNLDIAREEARTKLNEITETKQKEIESSLPHSEEKIDAIRDKIEDATPKQAEKYQAQISKLEEENRAHTEEHINNAPEVQQLRNELEDTQQKMRDMAPEIKDAYRVAHENLPETESHVVENVDRGNIEQQKASIIEDVSKKLIAANRPSEEANLAAQLIAEHYQARSERFGGKLGTAEEMYAKEGANIKAGREKSVPAKETPKSVTKYPTKNGIENEEQQIWHDLSKKERVDRLTQHQNKASQAVRQLKTQNWETGNMVDAGIVQNLLIVDKGINEEGLMEYTLIKQPDLNGISRQYTKTPHGGLIRGEDVNFREAIKNIERQQPSKPRELAQTAVAERRYTLEESSAANMGLGHDMPGRSVYEIKNKDGVHKGFIDIESIKNGVARIGDVIINSSEEARGNIGIGSLRDILGQILEKHPEITHIAGERISGARKGGVEGLPGKGVEVKQMLRTLMQEQRGKIRLATDEAKATITLMKSANASTFIHETGHHWLEELMKDAKHEFAPELLKADAEAVRKWLGVEEGADIARKQHEKFARGFERYLMEGVAPSKALANVFSKFKQWLVDIYKTVDRLRSPINDDIRNVFDRLLSSNPEKTVIAGEREAGKMMADIHEADALHTPIEHAATVRDDIRKEADKVAQQHDPEVANELRTGRPADETGGVATEATAPTADVATEGSTTGTQGIAPEPTTIRESGGAVREEGGAAPEKQPDGPNAIFGKPESNLVDKAGNIRLENLNTPENINEVLRQTAAENNGFTDARRGVISDAQAMDLADALGMSAKDLSFRKIGEAFNAEQILAARKLLIQSATDVRDLMTKAASSAGTDSDLMAYAEAKARHQMIQEHVSGITAEAGRALRAFRKLEGSEETKAIGDFLKQATGQDLFQLKEEARLGASLNTLQKVSKFINDSKRASFKDMLMEFWINSLLSGPVTHVKNIVGNALTALNIVPETALAAGIGKAREIITGTQEERVFLSESKARLFGITQSAKEGMQAAVHAFKDEDFLTGNHTIEQRKYQAIPSAKINVGGKEIEVGGKQIRLPGRLLSAQDEFFKTIAYRQELNALAYRTAETEGLSGNAFAGRVADIINNPTDEMMTAATKNAAYQTFTQELGETGKAIQRFSNSHFLAKMVVPFIRTPTNILKYSMERTPFGLLSQEIRANLSGINGAVARDTQMARMAMGSMVAVGTLALVNEGLLTGGGPADNKEKAMLRLTGWQPYSVKIGDTYYSYQWAEPMSTITGMVADMADLAKSGSEHEEDVSKIAATIVGSFSKNLMGKLSLRGASDLIQMVTDPDRYGPKYIQNMVSSFVPSALAQTARANDPVLRQSKTVLDAIKSRIPGLRSDLLPSRDVWGEPIANQGALGLDMLSPVYESKLNKDPVNQALLKLGVYPSKVSNKIRGVELTDAQYDDFAKTAGKMTKMRLDAVVNTPGFATVPANVQEDVIRKIIKSSRETARGIIMMRNPDIIQQATNNKLDELKGE